MTSIPMARFEGIYARDPDPWGFSRRWYEARKYALTLAALPEPRYHRAFEPGCSIGVLSEGLAPRCDYLLAVDGVAAAVEQARRRLAPFPHVEVDRRVVPDEWPDGPWDLVVVSELAYYLDRFDLGRLLDRVADTTVPGATLVAVHWRGETDYPQTGDGVHQAIHAHPAFGSRAEWLETEFRIDVFERHQ